MSEPQYFCSNILSYLIGISPIGVGDRLNSVYSNKSKEIKMAKKQVIATKKAAEAFGPYSQAVKSGDLIITSGQMGLDLSGKMIETGIEDETKQVLENLKAILEAADSSLDEVIKTTVFITDMNNFTKMNGIYGQYFTEGFPARSTVQVSALAKGANVEIEAIAMRK